jgi:hypothetical protein
MGETKDTDKKVVEVKELKTLLTKTKRVLTHHREMTKARGEHYNLFSVFGIETRENKTHSAFLADLLNPKGAHQMGDVFLQLFNTVVGHTKMVKDNNDKKVTDKTPAIKPFVWNSQTKVVVEKDIGIIPKDKKTGGRIDIFLTDNQNFISIENKIHAGDQDHQVERYCNYKPSNNTVYYLTLTGGEPSEDSKREKKVNQDFYNISYKEHIQDWLTLCLKEVTNFVSLRETINQYILLIKKLTYTLNNKQNDELTGVMLANIKEALFIAKNLNKALDAVRERFRITLKEALEEALASKKYDVSLGYAIDKKHAQIWIALKEQQGFRIGVESFSGNGHLDGSLFVGICNHGDSAVIKEIADDNKLNNMWRQVHRIKSNGGNYINLSNDYWIDVLLEEESAKYQELLALCKNQILAFIEQYKPLLIKDKK